MNKQTWKDPIILGAIAGSGIFKVKLKNTLAYKIIGSSGDEVLLNYKEGVWHWADCCTLIARHISSITEEELMDLMLNTRCSTKEVAQISLSIQGRQSILKDIVVNLTIDEFLHLLSIGVYPPNLSEEGVEFVNQKENNL